jgi:IS5 family transposase
MCAKNRRLFAFLRENRHRIFNDAIQEELYAMYRDTGAGRDPVVPAMMAMALIIQGYLGVSDADAVVLTVVDLRWQMVLGRVGAEKPAFSQGALFDFRQRIIANDMDRRLLEHTAEIARSTKGFDARKLPKTLRIAIDSSPLAGAGRVEDTINLIGHAARKVAKCAAELLERDFEAVCKQAGIPLLLEKSVKKALDRDWSDREQKAEAIDVLARQVLSLERWLQRSLAEEIRHPPLKTLVSVLRQLMDQDLEPDPNGDGVRIIDGVAEDRRISVEDGEMRHGRKSKSKRIDGYKRHVATDVDSDAILACALTPANQPEHEALPELKRDVEAQGVAFGEALFDRGYMGSPAVAELAAGGTEINCKPWRSRNGELFTKEDFTLDLRRMTIMCPCGCIQSIRLGCTVEFNSFACDGCPLRKDCTTAALGHGRTVSIAADERLQKRLREKAKTKSGRDQFRERVPVEHRLAHIGQRQGPRARYFGVRKNLYDLRRAALIQNLETAQRKAA